MKGKFKPKNPFRYKGNPTNIIYRSSWELKFMMQLDDNPKVKYWSSEEVRVRYISPKDKKFHNYYPDFLVTWDDNKTVLIEIKPERQTKPPKIKKKITRAYLTEVTTWNVNNAKFKAANIFAKARGWKFFLLTENGVKRCQ